MKKKNLGDLIRQMREPAGKEWFKKHGMPKVGPKRDEAKEMLAMKASRVHKGAKPAGHVAAARALKARMGGDINRGGGRKEDLD